MGQDEGRGITSIVTRRKPDRVATTICGRLGEAWMFTSSVGMDERGNSYFVERKAQRLWGPKELCKTGSFEFCEQGSIKTFYGKGNRAGSLSGFRGRICFSIGCGSQTAHGQVPSCGGHHGPGAWAQCIYGQDGFQIGACRRFVETNRPELVGHDVRSEGRVPSFTCTGRRQEMVKVQVGWSPIEIQGYAVWPAALAALFLQNNARVCKDFAPGVCGERLRSLEMQIPSCTIWCGGGIVCGRFCSCSSDEGIIVANSRRNFGAPSEGIGAYQGFRQGSMGASSSFRFSGFPTEYTDWTSYDPRRKVGEVFQGSGSNPFKRKDHAKGIGFGSWEDGIAIKSVRPGFDLYERVFQVDLETYGRQQRLVVAPTFVRDGKGGFILAPQKSAGKKRANNVEASAGSSARVRRGQDQQQGLGRNNLSRWAGPVGSGPMEPRSTGDGYSYSRDVRNFVLDPIVSDIAQGAKRSDSDRQYDLQEYGAQRVKGDRDLQSGEKNSRRGMRFGRDDNRRQLDSVGAQRGAGLALQISRRQRLAAEGREVETSHRQVARIGGGSLRIGSRGRKIAGFQYALGESTGTDGAGKRNGPKLEGNLFVRSASVGNDRPSATTSQRAESSRRGDRASVATNGVVTPIASNGGLLDRIRLRTRGVSAGPVGKVRTIQKPPVALSSGSSKRIKIPNVNEDRQELVKLYAKRGFESTTLVQYESHKKQYERYSRTLHLQPWPAEIRQLEEYMAWLIHSGRPGSIKGAWTSIMYFQSMQGRDKLQKSVTVKKLERAAEKALAERGHKPRDAFLSDMAKDYCVRTDENPSRERIMGAAILVVGMRGLLRAGEIMNLKFRHIQSRSDRYVQIDLVKRKNRVRGAAKIFIEASGNVTCPVRRLNEWLRVREREASCNLDDLVFSTHMKKGTQLSYAIIKNLVVKAAADAGYVDLNLSGHSLRIGGATEALIGGMTELQIRVMGDWKSDAYMRYLRGVEPAAAGATRLMGL